MSFHDFRKLVITNLYPDYSRSFSFSTSKSSKSSNADFAKSAVSCLHCFAELEAEQSPIGWVGRRGRFLGGGGFGSRWGGGSEGLGLGCGGRSSVA